MDDLVVTLLGILFWVMVFYWLIRKLIQGTPKNAPETIQGYLYAAKRLPMTQAEVDFFVKLNRTVSERYYVFPQLHLSAILDHKIVGQDWRSAFRYINGKSVDFVLCDKLSLRPTYAIELDDTTHDAQERRKRDIAVEKIFKEAQIPLIRIGSREIAENEIIQVLAKARSVVDW